MEFDDQEGMRPGIPVAPRALRFDLKDGHDEKHKTALLRWWPSQIFDENGNPSQEQKIVGYRIYVNGHPKGMVKAHKSRAIVEGLRLQNEYKITVVAIGTIGESAHSNAAIIYVPNMDVWTEEVKQKPRLSPSNISPDQTSSEVPVSKDIDSKFMLRTNVEVESVEDIISKIKAKFDFQTYEPKPQEPEKKPKIVNETTQSEDYEKLLNDLDEEGDDDIIEKVLKRYGLDNKDFTNAEPEMVDDENLTSQVEQIDALLANTHEISLD